MSRSIIVRLLSLVACLCCLSGIAAGDPLVVDYGPVTVTFNNTGDNGGTKDWTPSERAAVQSSIQMWDGWIADTPGRDVRLTMTWKSLAAGVLGSSASFRAGNDTVSFSLPEYAWLGGQSETFGTPFDTIITFSTNFGFYMGESPSGIVGTGLTDFRSVMAHELGHSLGFTSTWDHDAQTFSGGTGTNGGLSIFDTFLVDGDGTTAEAGTSGTGGTTPGFNDVDNPVYWTGPLAVSANDGNPVPIYAPTTWNAGSSMSHLDWGSEATPIYSDGLMNWAIASETIIRTPNSLELAMWQDMGWTITPEPATFISILTLMGMIAGRLRQRREAIAKN